jgi:hypothetical protein
MHASIIDAKAMSDAVELLRWVAPDLPNGNILVSVF